MPHHWVQTVPFTPEEAPYHRRPKLKPSQPLRKRGKNLHLHFGASEALTINPSLSLSLSCISFRSQLSQSQQNPSFLCLYKSETNPIFKTLTLTTSERKWTLRACR